MLKAYDAIPANAITKEQKKKQRIYFRVSLIFYTKFLQLINMVQLII